MSQPRVPEDYFLGDYYSRLSPSWRARDVAGRFRWIVARETGRNEPAPSRLGRLKRQGEEDKDERGWKWKVSSAGVGLDGDDSRSK